MCVIIVFMVLALLRRRSRDNDDTSIIDELARVPANNGWPATPPKPAPPPRVDRPELHITGPSQIPRFIPKPRPSRGRVLLASRATLPLFRETAHSIGWRAFILPRRPRMTATTALRIVQMYTDKSNSMTCSQTEACKAELWERSLEYDRREAELRARYPLSFQNKM